MKKSAHVFFLFLLIVVITSCGSENNLPELKLIPVQNGNEFEYIDQDGKIAINPQFSQAGIFKEGLALVKSAGENPKWGYIAENGNYAIAASFKEATYFNEGLAWVVSENGAPVAINRKGETKITLPDVQEVSIFSEGLAAFSVEDNGSRKWGFVDKEGKTRITPQFSSVGLFRNGKCAVQNDGKWGVYRSVGKACHQLSV